ncbi:MAG: sigma factor-like helix-turn-helix DNA-binding protein [Tepidisphaeraceae bacterium]
MKLGRFLLQRLPFPRFVAHTVGTSNVDSNVVDDALPRARKMHRDAVETVLRANYPRVCRIAMALCGREADGKAVVKTVVGQSLRALPWWSNAAEATGWFLHHTVLTTREIAGKTPDPSEDCLVLTLSNPPPEHVAFVKALRLLPAQQREAFLLFRGEHLDPRQTAVAMDCSTGAAANHHIAANRALTAIAGDTFDARVAELVRVYATLTPPEDLTVGDVGSIAHQLRWRRMLRFLRRFLILAILAAIAWMIWQLSRMIVT